MRLKQLFGVVAVFAVGLLGCGPVDGDGQVGLPIHVTVNSPSAATALVSLDFELFGELGLVLDEGDIISEAMIRDGETFVVDSAVFASPGNELSIGLTFSVDDGVYLTDRALLLIQENTAGVEVHLTNREDLGTWLYRIGTMTAPVEPPVE